MIKKIVNAFKEGTLFKKIYNNIYINFIQIIRYFFIFNIKINKNKILFLTFQGNFNCNPKAIANEIIRKKLPCDLVWAVRKENLNELKQYPKELRLVKRNSLKFYKEAASAKIIVDNANNFKYLKLKKRKGQYLLQPWHGSMGFKKLDSTSVKNNNWVKKALLLDKITDYCIVNSDFEIEVFQKSYWPNTPMLKYGHPRNDVLFNLNNEFEEYGNKVRKIYKIGKNTKIALYAPTFRDDCDFNSYNLNYNLLLKALEKRFGGNWCILVRFHFKLKYAKIPKQYLEKVINVTDYPDIQELMCASDIGITDYSSWLCDFMLTYRPGFLFTLDIEKYINERGFYYPLEISPFPVSKTNEELYQNILKFDEKKYKKNVTDFLKKMGSCEKGKASEKVIDKIKELIKK